MENFFSAAWSRGLKIDGKQGAKSERLGAKRIVASGFSLKSGEKTAKQACGGLTFASGRGFRKENGG